MSFGNTFETELLALILNGTAIDNIADNAASSPLANLYVSLHTADPGEAGSQTTSEANYTSYARVAVARTSGGWTVADGGFENTAEIAFPKCTGGTNQVTWFAIGTASSGAGKVILRGQLDEGGLAISNNITPRFPAGSLVGSLD